MDSSIGFRPRQRSFKSYLTIASHKPAVATGDLQKHGFSLYPEGLSQPGRCIRLYTGGNFPVSLIVKELHHFIVNIVELLLYGIFSKFQVLCLNFLISLPNMLKTLCDVIYGPYRKTVMNFICKPEPNPSTFGDL